jgi:hypothetical protein
MDKKLAADKIRARLEKRLATFLGCEMEDHDLALNLKQGTFDGGMDGFDAEK